MVSRRILSQSNSPNGSRPETFPRTSHTSTAETLLVENQMEIFLLEPSYGVLWKKAEPRLPETIRHFWFGLFNMASGIKNLHMYKDGVQWWNGCVLPIHFPIYQNWGHFWQDRSWHFDIKPDNTLLVGDEWKVGDPGFARVRKHSEGEIPKMWMDAGTRTWGNYLSPNSRDFFQTG